MPEGHVIHRLARMLTTEFAGQPVHVFSPQGVFASQAALLDGTVLERAEAFGKHLFINFSAPSPECIVHIHLGLIGSLGFQAVDRPLQGKVRLALSNDAQVAHLHGPQWCRLITDEEMAAATAKLGADPLRTDQDEKRAEMRARVLKSRRTVGSLLMDQGLYAGVGNIYRAETLFRLGIHPDVRGVDLEPAQVDAVWEDLVALMRAGEAAGRIDTVRPEHMPEAMGRAPRKDDHGGEVYVYRRAGLPCYVCGAEIQERVLEGRNLFWCPGCQGR
ncbi:Fpg/Nei family DNA glycosylase [Corynebacterium sp. 320]|uniref:Fpg/Nei family DNA glycosylase n=1 Tax=Corynebacterium TaxID=1716 RepID=UPI00125CD23D|nr:MULTISPECIES: DNA-formamidopyrimidine glycosylase family protein [Corynebacterium]KAB1503013.1 Fpg/Nei family DNA glycosylase [Corynebacterium sp. 320]KAB1550778.1 Fpg/Nei family DNA glycosylase [Corynebacterium sp. 321]KAB1551135.1 Fpg/Nei family DNA glycosylase [Corynebacterium sp. 319]KAB3526810.1 Fpg/Nei family DNA glycosylase [Corynebacterium sp. 250]KAB3538303.1 Fpg/Nei family DNA glycosylase [Corynebacterium sp. 366]